MKEYIVYAGVNGAGKTTLYLFHQSIITVHNARVNPDEIVQRIGSWKNEKDQIQAAKIAVRKIHEYINEGISFNQETTLGGRSTIQNIKKAKSKGFKTILYYVGLESVELAIERVKQRVINGGHDIPEDLIKRRYTQSLENLKAVMPYCDEISIYDNTRLLNPVCVIKGKSLTWLKKCNWLEPILANYQIERIEQNLMENGYKPNKKLVDNILQINKEFKNFYTIDDIIEMLKDVNSFNLHQKVILNNTMNDFNEIDNR